MVTDGVQSIKGQTDGMKLNFLKGFSRSYISATY